MINRDQLEDRRIALIGHTGFVGETLKRQYTGFTGYYNSANIMDIQGREYDLIICAAAPATMWMANNAPDQDRQNLLNLHTHLRGAKCQRIVLISTIAVLDDFNGKYSEKNSRFQDGTAYGKHRRELEVNIKNSFPNSHILRLPALFGAGLKKNFIFDILNPAPSFLKQVKADELLCDMKQEMKLLFESLYQYDSDTTMLKLDRQKYEQPEVRPAVNRLFDIAGFSSSMFTNSESTFQYYNMNNLWTDIRKSVNHDLETLHICSAPLKAGIIHEYLTGKPFSNTAPAEHHEDMRTVHAEKWGKEGEYLYSTQETLDALKAFYDFHQSEG